MNLLTTGRKHRSWCDVCVNWLQMWARQQLPSALVGSESGPLCRWERPTHRDQGPTLQHTETNSSNRSTCWETLFFTFSLRVKWGRSTPMRSCSETVLVSEAELESQPAPTSQVAVSLHPWLSSGLGHKLSEIIMLRQVSPQTRTNCSTQQAQMSTVFRTSSLRHFVTCLCCEPPIINYFPAGCCSQWPAVVGSSLYSIFTQWEAEVVFVFKVNLIVLFVKQWSLTCT